MHNLNYQSKNSRIQQRPRESVQEPARRTPSMDKIPRIKPSKSSQSLASVGSSGRVSNEYTPKSKLRPPAKVTRSNSNSSVKSTDKVTKRKSLSKLEKPPSLPDNDPNLLCPQRLARSSSNGSGSATSSGTSASTSEKRRRMADKKLREASAEQESAIEQLQEDLEREKLSVRTLQGQKEGKGYF